MDESPHQETQLCLAADGSLFLSPREQHPRLERAFSAGAGRGMLDLLRYGVPPAASPLLHWLRQKAGELMVACLRGLRRGDSLSSFPLPADAELARWLESMPPPGTGELSVSLLRDWLSQLPVALAELARRECCSPEQWLSRLGEGWQQLGAVCFHLAENDGENAAAAPFAFLATFVHKVGHDGKARHLPLGYAATELANDHAALLEILRPLQAAAAQSAFLNELINSQEVYKPCAWTPRRALEFLREVPVLEAVGIEVRMVNLWKKEPPRVSLQVKFELPEKTDARPSDSPSLNLRSLLHFSPQIVLGDSRLTEEEWQELMAGEDGLVRFRGEWVLLDKEKLQRLMDSWWGAARMAQEGIPLLSGLRFLLAKRGSASVPLPLPAPEVQPVAGARLALAISNLKFGNSLPDLPAELAATLRPYQHEGVRFLLNVTEAGFGACLADDMGLGKTLQVIAWLLHLKRTGVLGSQNGPALVVTPASLLTNWQRELEKFAPQLRVLLLHPYALSRAETNLLHSSPRYLLRRADVVLTTYGIAAREESLAKQSYAAMVLDEAQAIKNATSQRSQAILRFQSPRRVALTGTPVENGLGELRSLFEFLNPGLLGSQKEYAELLRSMGNDFAPLRRLVRPFLLRRLKTDPSLLPDLPPKTEQPCFCYLTPEQAALYAREVEALRAVIEEQDAPTRLMLMLPILGRLKQICNHPAQYRGENYYDPAASGKFSRLGHLARSICEAGDCCLVFTQYRSIMPFLHDFLKDIFGSPGLILNGSTPLPERRRMVEAFSAPGGPRFFLLSLRAAGTGLTLTRARHVIHFDRWWNPAVENQASDRAHRLGQTQPVLIHPLICTGTIEENIHSMLQKKMAMADSLLSGGLEKLLLDLSAEELLQLVGKGIPN